jgi:hypothetical protein
MSGIFVIENGFNSEGNVTITGSLNTTGGFIGNFSGSFSGSFQGSGANLTGLTTTASPPAGTMVLIDASENIVSGTTNTTAKTYTLASNTYSSILIETEVGFRSNANTNGIVTFNIIVGGVTKRSHNIEFDATGAGDQFESGRPLKYSEAITAGATITITTTGTANGTWEVDSLRVYGIV